MTPPFTGPRPVLLTPRLRLRPLDLADAPRMRVLANRREVSDAMISLPHPYPEGLAESWICGHEAEWVSGQAVHFALEPVGNPWIGCISLRAMDWIHLQAELGFWLGMESWGQGYATEAARAVVRFAVEDLGLNRVYAHHMVRNPASGRVLRKAGLRPEGVLRERVRKWGIFEDVVVLAVLASEVRQPGAGG